MAGYFLFDFDREKITVVLKKHKGFFLKKTMHHPISNDISRRYAESYKRQPHTTLHNNSPTPLNHTC